MAQNAGSHSANCSVLSTHLNTMRPDLSWQYSSVSPGGEEGEEGRDEPPDIQGSAGLPPGSGREVLSGQEK